MKTTLLLTFILLFCKCYSQQDTIVNGKHFNTIIYYPYFDYKCNDTTKNNYVVGIGNIIDSVKTGLWTYYLSDGRILAKGKYKNGYKNGKWVYLGNQLGLIWDKSAKAKDYIRFNSTNKRAEIVDIVDTKFTSCKMINGYSVRSPMTIHFL